jgi:hypothetical protein
LNSSRSRSSSGAIFFRAIFEKRCIMQFRKPPNIGIMLEIVLSEIGMTQGLLAGLLIQTKN